MQKIIALLLALLVIVNPVLADQRKISDLPSVTSPQLADFFPVVSSLDGQTRKMTISQVASFIDTGIADGAITTDKLATSAVTTAKIADSNVTTAKIADANITTAKIANGAITNTKIAAGNITATELASNAVTTAKILDANVTTAKIADANVTAIKIADNNITTAKIVDANVTTAKIANSNVTTAKIADANVTTDKLANGAVTQLKRAALGHQIASLGNTSGSSGGGTTLSSSLSVTITSTGRPMFIGLYDGYFSFSPNGSANPALMHAIIKEGSTTIFDYRQLTRVVGVGDTFYINGPDVWTILPAPQAGSHVYNVHFTIDANGTANSNSYVLNGLKLIAYEL